MLDTKANLDTNSWNLNFVQMVRKELMFHYIIWITVYRGGSILPADVPKIDQKYPCFIYSGGNGPQNAENIKYLGVTITNDLRWNTHISNVCTKANRTLGFLRRNLYASPQEEKEAANVGKMCKPKLSSEVELPR